jgi:hypothetical protein
MAETDVRHAFTGPEVEHDQLIDFIVARNHEDAKRSSSSGESRALIGGFIEETGINSQALSWMRSVMKKKDEQKALDVIRSLELILPMVKAHVTGQQSDMDFDEPLEPASELPKPSYQPQGGDDPEIAADASDFEKHLDEVAAP